MKRIILPAEEIERNNRVKQLLNNKVERKKLEPEKLTQDEMFELKSYMKNGFSRKEAVELILQTRKLLNSKEVKKTNINNWNAGGFISDEKYKQPIKHRF
jgi:hypothetical protein